MGCTGCKQSVRRGRRDRNDSARRCGHPGHKAKTPWSFIEILVMGGGVVLIERRWERHIGNACCGGYGDACKR